MSMLKTLALALCLATAVGCKTDAPSTSSGPAAENAPTAAPTVPKGRSGKIDLGPRRPALPDTAAPADDRSATRATREERRAQRMSMLDTDGDGQVSDAERAAARQLRQEEMMARLDTDGDGQVSEAERAAARQQRTENVKTRLDTNGDGKLTTAELEGAPFRRFDPATADANKDGEISTEELTKAMETRGGRRGGWGGRGRFGRGGEGSGSAP